MYKGERVVVGTAATITFSTVFIFKHSVNQHIWKAHTNTHVRAHTVQNECKSNWTSNYIIHTYI